MIVNQKSKTLFAALACCMLCACLATPSHAQEVLGTITSSKLVGIMKKQGFEVSDDPNGILWMLDGARTKMFVAKDGESIQFYVAFKESEANARKVNDWNKSKRYSKSYLDDSGDPCLELDLDLTGGVTEARIVDFLGTCRLSMSSWFKEVVQ